MFLTVGPERYSAPPVETWMMPSDAGVGEALQRGVQGLRGRHVDRRERERLAFAASSISAYFSGVAMGMRSLLGNGRDVPNPSGYPWVRPGPPVRLHP